MGKLPPLSRRERQIMEIMYARQGAAEEARERGETLEGGSSISDVIAGMHDPPSYSAVRALVNILERKGHVKHKQIGSRYVYEPTTSRKMAAKSALRRLLETFFAGSIENALATHLADPKTRLSAEEGRRLNALIEGAQKRGTSGSV